MLMNILQRTGQPPHKIIWPRMPVLARQKSCSGRIPKLLTGLPLGRRTQDADGKEFKIFSIYYLQYSSFSVYVSLQK